jgi:hypothetical protein
MRPLFNYQPQYIVLKVVWQQKSRITEKDERPTSTFAWFPCSGVATHMVCIPTLEHGNEKLNF